MYAFIAAALFFIGVALLMVVLVRKIPVLAELPVSDGTKRRRPEIFERLRALFARIDRQKWQRRVFSALAAAADVLQRFFVRAARRFERFARRSHERVRSLSAGATVERSALAFAARIRRRSAYVEEERRLIEELAGNPQNLDAYRRLGNLYVIAGNRADARAAFTEVLRLAPDDEDAQRRLEELTGNGIGGT